MRAQVGQRGHIGGRMVHRVKRPHSLQMPVVGVVLTPSIHSYTVVTITDSTGNVVRSYDVDNYIGPTSVKPGNPPNFDPIAGDSIVVKTVKPK